MKRRSRSIIYLVLAVILLLSTLVRAYGDYGRDNPSSDGEKLTVGMPEYLKDQIIVKFKDDISSKDKKDLKKLYKLMDKARFASGGEVLKLKGKMTVEELVHELGMLESVEYAGFDYIIKAVELDMPSPSEYSELWGMKVIDASGDSSDPDYPNDPRAWEIDHGNQEVIVAVIDTGVDMDHDDLKGNIWTNPGEFGVKEDGSRKENDGIDNDGNGYVDDVHGYDFYNKDNDPSDDQGHGTHCSGTIAAAANGTGVVGVAPNVKIMPLKFLDDEGSGSFSDAILAINYAASKEAHVISASWGGYTEGIEPNMSNAIDNFKGVFVAAAGNDGLDMDLYEVLLNLYHAPATYPNDNIVSVASMDEDGSVSSFSNYGTRDYDRESSTVDLLAPGSGILSTLPGDNYGIGSGTSMATPHVSGVLALMISHEMNLNGYAERSNLRLIDDLLDSVEGDSYMYYVKSGGCLNAYNALLLTPDYGLEPPPTVNNPPVNITPPAIDGILQVGSELKAMDGTWKDEDSTDHSGETNLIIKRIWQVKVNKNRIVDKGSSETYVLSETDENKQIRLMEIATDSGGLTSTASSGWYDIMPAGAELPPEEGFSVSIDFPAAGARNIPLNAVIVLSFSEAVNEETLNIDALSLSSRTHIITLTEDDIDFSANGLEGSIYAEYNNKTKYTLTVNKELIKNEDGEYLTDKLVTSFTTVR